MNENCDKKGTVPFSIEWRRLVQEGNTCQRCGETGANLEETVHALMDECRPRGVEITFTKVELSSDQIEQSNLMLLNGIPIEAVLEGMRRGDSECRSCSELTGTPAACRTLERDGVRHEVVPPELIREAVCKLACCCPAPAPAEC